MSESYVSGQNPIGTQLQNVEYNTKFSEAQLQQFVIFEKEYGHTNTEIKKHPEWSATFMNYFLHAEGKNQQLLPYYEVADWLREHPVPTDQKYGVIGCDSMLLSKLVELTKAGRSLPKELPVDSNGVVDEYMLVWNLIQNILEISGHPKLISGRFCINEIDLLDENYVYSEGIKEANDILQQLASMSSHNTPRVFNATDPMAAMSENYWARTSIKLTLDDMNIRGRQVIDALEYADGSIQKLYDFLNQRSFENTRDINVAKYCNMKAAKRIEEGVSKSEYIAVQHGASFDKMDMGTMPIGGYRNPDLIPYRYKMSMLNYKEYLVEIEPISTDWSKIDIIQDTDISTALKAAEARGFKVIKQTGLRESWGDMCRSILMYNPQTGAFIEMPSAQDKDVCYGGCDLDLWHKVNTIPWEMIRGGSSGAPNHYTELRWNQFTHNDGLFSVYDNIALYLNAEDIDWHRLGFIGMDTMPVARYYDKPYQRENDLAVEIGWPDAHMLCDMGGFRIQCMINNICAHYDKDIDFEVCPQYKLITNDHVGFTSGIYHLGLWGTHDLDQGLKLVRLAKLYLQMPDSEYDKMIVSLRNMLREEDQSKLDRINDPSLTPGAKQQLENQYQSLDKYCEEHINILYGFPNDELIVEKALVSGGRGIETLGVSLPWM